MILSRKKFPPMSFWLVMAGLCFFFNPNLALIDFLPDFIGCILVYFGLTRVARVSAVMQEARAKFLKLSVVCVARDILVLIVQGSSAANEKATSLLLIAFSAAFLFLWFAFSALRALFDGFYGLAVLGDCTPLYSETINGKKMKQSKTEAVMRRVLTFLVIREAVCVLPELSALSAASDEFNANYINMYEYIGIMRLLAAFVVLIFGILYLVRIVGYFRLVQKQKQFRTQLGEKERTIAEKYPGNAVTRRYTLSFLLMGVGVFFLTDFYLDFTNIIPDALAAVCLILGVLISDLARQKKWILSGVAALYGIAATVSSHFAASFYDVFSNAQVGHNELADRAYSFMWGSALLEMLVFLALLVLLLLFLRVIIDKWGGYLAVEEDSEFETRRREAFLEEFDGELIRTFILGLIAALFSFVYDYMKIIPANRWLRFLEFFWAFDFCATLLFATMFAVLLGNVLGAIKQRFMYD